MKDTIRLWTKDREDVKSLLEDHQKVTDALERGGRPTWNSVILVMNTDDNEAFEVDLGWQLARAALIAQRDWIEGELIKHGIELKS